MAGYSLQPWPCPIFRPMVYQREQVVRHLATHDLKLGIRRCSILPRGSIGKRWQADFDRPHRMARSGNDGRGGTEPSNKIADRQAFRSAASHPLAVMNTTAARSQKRNDCFWRDKPVNQVVTDDRVWVGSRRCSVRVANGVCGWLPRCKHKVMIWCLVGCSRLSGLLMQSAWTAGPDGVREQGPDRLCRL